MIIVGKSYFKELGQLKDTLIRAIEADVSDFSTYVKDIGGSVLWSIGSGGSFSTALFSSLLYQKLGGLSLSSTPLDFIMNSSYLDAQNILLLTAGGRNKDIISAYQNALVRNPNKIGIICGNKKSRIKKYIKNSENTFYFEYPLPDGKDGFLAVNSIAFFSTILARGYENYFNININESKIDDIFVESNDFIEYCTDNILNISDMESVIVLYGPTGKPAAFDLESKFTESGLKNVQLSDYRNFGHGRHYWLAKNPEKTGVIFYVSDEDKKIAQKLIKYIPSNIPSIVIDSKLNFPVNAISLLIKTFYFIGIYGKEKNIDPGNIQVPSFGRKIYHLTIPKKIVFYEMNNNHLEYLKKYIIHNKLSQKIHYYENSNLCAWIKYLNIFIEKLEKSNIQSIIFDYDGTLCKKNEKNLGASQKMGEIIHNLIDDDILIGVATGRGKSVRKDLQRILPKKTWDNLIIGYYNGSDISKLNDNKKPDKSLKLNEELKNLLNILENNKIYEALFRFETRPNQITVTSKIYSLHESWSIINELVVTNKLNLTVMMSDHSIDILSTKANKLHVYNEIKNIVNKNHLKGEILCIGDKGKWPGNDYFLLTTPFSLSVDTVSLSPVSCWNLSLPGIRNVYATMKYLEALITVNGTKKFKYSKLISNYDE